MRSRSLQLTILSFSGFVTRERDPTHPAQVDLRVGEVRLDPGTTKNREGRVFYLTPELHQLLNDNAPLPTRSRARRG
jgi:hypothetical protein